MSEDVEFKVQYIIPPLKSSSMNGENEQYVNLQNYSCVRSRREDAYSRGGEMEALSFRREGVRELLLVLRKDDNVYFLMHWEKEETEKIKGNGID